MLFRKKKKEKKIDFKNYQLKMNIRSMCFFEQLTGKSFFEFQDEDTLKFLYCMFVVNNPIKITYEAFEILLEDPKITEWVLAEYNKQNRFDFQLKYYQKEIPNEEGGTDTKIVNKISLLASMLISHGIDPHYVMYDMEPWEMNMYVEAIQDEDMERMEEQRLWTYIGILPHLDKKSAQKFKTPQDLIKFPWEKEKDKTQDFEANAASAFNFLTKQVEE